MKRASLFIVTLLALVFAGCAKHGGGGNEIGNGGDSDFILVEHARDFAPRMLDRFDDALLPALLAPTNPDAADVAWLIAKRGVLAKALREAELVWTYGLPSFCPRGAMACARLWGSQIWFDRKQVGRLKDYRDAARLLLHEAAHLVGEADETRANRCAVMAMNAWKRLGHPDAPHWLSLPDSPLESERITHDPDLIRHQYSDWTGERLKVWDERYLQTYDPARRTWNLEPLRDNALGWRRSKGVYGHEIHKAAWVNGHGVVVAPCRSWQPQLKGKNAAGVRFAESERRWMPITDRNAPIDRMRVGTAKSQTQFILWGGAGCYDPPAAFDDGALYDPAADRWDPIAQDAATPTPRYAHGQLWTGKHLVVWGGFSVYKRVGKPGVAEAVNTGALYDPATRKWEAIAVDAETPSPRVNPRLTWTGRELLVFGGEDTFNGRQLRTGAAYNPIEHTWRSLPRASEGAAVVTFQPAFAFWSGSQLAFVAREFFSFFDPIRKEWGDWGRPSIPDLSRHSRLYWTGVEAVVWDPETRRGALLYP